MNAILGYVWICGKPAIDLLLWKSLGVVHNWVYINSTYKNLWFHQLMYLCIFLVTTIK